MIKHNDFWFKNGGKYIPAMIIPDVFLGFFLKIKGSSYNLTYYAKQLPPPVNILFYVRLFMSKEPIIEALLAEKRTGEQIRAYIKSWWSNQRPITPETRPVRIADRFYYKTKRRYNLCGYKIDGKLGSGVFLATPERPYLMRVAQLPSNRVCSKAANAFITQTIIDTIIANTTQSCIDDIAVKIINEAYVNYR